MVLKKINETIKHVGSQSREPIEDTEYKLDSMKGKEATLLNTDSGTKELWVLNDNAASYVIEIKGKGYEFVSDI